MAKERVSNKSKRHVPEGGIFLTKFKRYLDRLRENVDVLDEAIANAQAMSKARKGAELFPTSGHWV